MKKKKTICRISVAVVLIFILIFTLSSCSGSSTSEPIEPTKTEADASIPECALTDTGYSFSGDKEFMYYWGKISNLDDKYTIIFPVLECTAYNANGDVIANDSTIGSNIAVGDDIILNSLMSISEPVERVEFNYYYEYNYSLCFNKDDYTVNNVHESGSGIDYKITGSFSYHPTKEIDDIYGFQINAVFLKDQKMVYTDNTSVDYVVNKTDYPFEINLFTSKIPDYDDIQIYIMNW